VARAGGKRATLLAAQLVRLANQLTHCVNKGVISLSASHIHLVLVFAHVEMETLHLKPQGDAFTHWPWRLGDTSSP
jgi:hypothetical protein